MPTPTTPGRSSGTESPLRHRVRSPLSGAHDEAAACQPALVSPASSHPVLSSCRGRALRLAVRLLRRLRRTGVAPWASRLCARACAVARTCAHEQLSRAGYSPLTFLRRAAGIPGCIKHRCSCTMVLIHPARAVPKAQNWPALSRFAFVPAACQTPMQIRAAHAAITYRMSGLYGGRAHQNVEAEGRRGAANGTAHATRKAPPIVPGCTGAVSPEHRPDRPDRGDTPWPNGQPA